MKKSKKRVSRPAIITIQPPAEPDTGLPEPQDLAPRAFDQQGVSEQVKRLYPRLKEEDIKSVTEEVWSRLEFDTPYSRASSEKLGWPNSYTLLYEWTWPERFDVLERIHQVVERNPIAKAAVMWMRIFVVGNGGMLSYQSAEAREVIEEFRANPLNSIESYEREFCDGLGVDGEVMVRFFQNDKGQTVIIPIQPWHIFEISTDPQNYKKPLSYKYISVGGQAYDNLVNKDVPAEEIMHVAINKYAYELRGRPDLFCELPWFKAYKDMLEERARVHRRKSIYYHIVVKNSTQSQLAAMQNKFLTPPPPGTIFVTNENVEIKPVQANINAEQADADLTQMKLMAIVGTGEPEFFFGSSENSTLASATAQTVPVLKLFDDRQDILEGFWKRIYQRVLQNAIDAGRFNEEVEMVDENGESLGETIKLLDSFDYQYPEIRERDVLNLAKALQISEQMGWSSNQTNSAKMGFIPSVEKLKIKSGEQRAPVQSQPIGRTKNNRPDGANYAEGEKE